VAAAGIEDDDVDAAACGRHAAEDESDVQPRDRNLVLASYLGIDRDQVVVVPQLQAMASVIDHGNRVFTELLAESTHGVDEPGAIEVFVQCDGKARFA